MNIQEARIEQKKAETKSLMILFSSVLVAAIAWFVIEFFTDLFQQYSVLYALLVLIVILGVKFSSALEFLKPREFVGSINHMNTHVERVQKYASNQPGTKAGAEYMYMEMVATNDKGKTMSKNFLYKWNFDNLRENDKIVFLRFIEQPVLPEE